MSISLATISNRQFVVKIVALCYNAIGKMKKESIISSVIILPEDDTAAIVAKKNNLIQALAAGRGESSDDGLDCLRAAYETARVSGTKEEEARLIRAINRTLEMRRFQR